MITILIILSAWFLVALVAVSALMAAARRSVCFDPRQPSPQTGVPRRPALIVSSVEESHDRLPGFGTEEGLPAT